MLRGISPNVLAVCDGLAHQHSRRGYRAMRNIIPLVRGPCPNYGYTKPCRGPFGLFGL